MCFRLPRSSILCGCINIPGRQVNAVWGRYPTACTLYVTKKLGVCWGLVDKISPAFELRNSDVRCAGAGSRQVDVEVGTYRSPTKAGAVGRHTLQSSVVPVSFPFFSVTVLPALCCSSWAVSSLYLPKTALAALGRSLPFLSHCFAFFSSLPLGILT